MFFSKFSSKFPWNSTSFFFFFLTVDKNQNHSISVKRPIKLYFDVSPVTDDKMTPQAPFKFALKTG